MSIFDKFKNQALGETRLSPRAAMYLSAITMFGADGDISAEDWTLILDFYE